MNRIRVIGFIVIFLVFGSAGVSFALNNQMIQIKTKYGYGCSIVETCDDMVYIDCGAAVDGPAYYLDKNLEFIGPSGGLCMQGCTGSPKEWDICDGKQYDGPSILNKIP
jgi:hypothetical protein